MKPAGRIGVGVVGCGEIAQLMHLPCIAELDDFSLAGLCDLSAGVLARLGEQYSVGATYRDHRELLADPAIDAIVICNNDHGAIVADAIAAKKHFIVEKPVAFTLEEAASLPRRATEAGIVGMVGYMKLFDPGFQYGRERIRTLGAPTSIRVHDFSGRFDRYKSLYTQTLPADVPAAVLAEGKRQIDLRIAASLGAKKAGYSDLYTTILMLGSHDLAVLRSIFGPPARVAYAQAIGPTHVLAVLEYAGGVPAILEIAFGTRYEWWDEVVEVRSLDAEVRIEFANPYHRHHTATVRVREAIDELPSERMVPGTPDTSFRRQWKHFAAAIRSEEVPVSTLYGGVSDIRLARAIIDALPPKAAIDVGSRGEAIAVSQ
ncbi:Gfo/Idh/MocA family oxidoreductase [Mesorhizobium sp. M7A.F.Ca.US.006.01.1.1]|uniref:Gfo/Idh/MocA family oxidoreductase n=1 Tax=Mesorhizobium sp. M7A.F.Ca.US.006.01.1.1 TaxID=2496707 RepID=UPI000FCB7345|nr:Gfo/Idh/MocA family oxidoreductase [Mesorhizobium sp. M7A.F.Ca.US.006.01.1.1]RUZ74038.1 Gfo/Idh/MocA family oxidoreductase [Mesorhizobium sp. M7A.F.Ca.US.006.01.1.1]